MDWKTRGLKWIPLTGQVLVKSSYELKPGSIKSIYLFYQNQSASLSRGLCFGFSSTNVKQRIELETLRLFRGFNVHKLFKNNKAFSYGRVPMLPVANNFSMPLSGDFAFTYTAMLARSGRRLFVRHCSRKHITPAQPHRSRLDITTVLTISAFQKLFLCENCWCAVCGKCFLCPGDYDKWYGVRYMHAIRCGH